MKAVFDHFVPDVPAHVALERQRQDYQRSRLFNIESRLFVQMGEVASIGAQLPEIKPLRDDDVMKDGVVKV